MVRRSSEARFRLHELGRYAEEDVRRAWNSMSTQRKVAQELDTQSKVSDDLLLSYREQFNVGRRSLLDVLDAQNTRYNVQVRLETAQVFRTVCRISGAGGNQQAAGYDEPGNADGCDFGCTQPV